MHLRGYQDGGGRFRARQHGIELIRCFPGIEPKFDSIRLKVLKMFNPASQRASRFGNMVRSLFNRAGMPKSDSGISGFSVAEVAKHYDETTCKYMQSAGPFIQAFRGRDTDALMEYYVERFSLSDGMTVLDAGCGVAAPAIWLAKRFSNIKIDCLTNSPVQAEIARSHIDEAGLVGRLSITLGDYHRLGDTYAPGVFDRALFLETLNHSYCIDSVLTGLHVVMKRGGRVCVKDFFRRRASDPRLQAEIDGVVRILNESYRYNAGKLSDLIESCMENGFLIGSVSPPNFESDFSLTMDFEIDHGFDSHTALAKSHAIDWYEVEAIRE